MKNKTSEKINKTEKREKNIKKKNIYATKKHLRQGVFQKNIKIFKFFIRNLAIWWLLFAGPDLQFQFD